MSILHFRQYGRVPVDIPIKFYPPQANQAVNAYLNNLSEEGGSLICPFSIPVATVMEFDIKLPKVTLPVHAVVEVLWSRPVKENGLNVFAHGLMFTRLGVDDRDRLHEYISQTASY